MLKRKILLAIIGAVAVALLLAFLIHRHSMDSVAQRAELLSLMPADANAVAFLDLQQLRSSPFLQQILSWAPQAAPDSDYAQFLQVTGFDYERDLDRVALAFQRQSPSQTSWVFAIAEGRFDRKKIEAYAARFGTLKTVDGRTLFAVPSDGSPRKVYFTFLRDDRIAWANDSSCFFQRQPNSSAQAWHEHFSRVAGTPMFAVFQQDFAPESALNLAPGGFRSPQLATLLAQLQWITISAKPEGNVLRVVADGESVSESTARQFKEILSGLVVLAEVGLSDAKTRKELDPQLRQGYLELLQSADIQELDRGSSKSVRVIFGVAPKLLETLRSASPPAADPTGSKQRSKKQTAKN
jgi:hypothetical protein